MRVWCDKKFQVQAKKLIGSLAKVEVIPAGKLRRYANLSWWYRYFSWYHITKTHIPNFIDLFKILAGFIVSFCKLLSWRPDVIFCKGGYVCLPVGVLAHVLNIPLVIHDSDTVAGLTNRILARWALKIGTGAPVDNYPSYPKSRTEFIGIPVRPNFTKLVGNEIKITSQKDAIKKGLGLKHYRRPLVLAMGGGLGSSDINALIQRNAHDLTSKKINVVLLTGKDKKVNFLLTREQRTYIKTISFMPDTAKLIQASDLVITRAGATTMAELASVAAATILIPSPYLAGDHQTKNAKVYQRAGAALVLDQMTLKKQPYLLYDLIIETLNNKATRTKLANNLAKFARKDSLGGMVDMIEGAINESRQ